MTTIGLVCVGLSVFYGITAHRHTRKSAKIARYISSALFFVASVIWFIK